MEDFQRAEPLFREARDVYGQLLGLQHPVYAASLNNLAGLYERMGEYARAESLYRQALQILKSVPGRNHPHYAIALNNLAVVYREMGDYDRAESLFEEAIELEKSVLGAHHRQYARSLNNLAQLYDNSGSHARAEPLVMEAHAVLLSAAGQALPALSDAQARAWMERHRPRTDLVLTALDRLEKWDVPEAYEAVWGTKLLVSRLRVGLDPPPESAPQALEAYAQLRDARLRLARLVSATPEPERADQYQEALVAASEAKESLEKELARLNPPSRRELAIRDATIDELHERLPEGVAVVDFVKWDRWQISAEEITLTDESGHSETRTVSKRTSTPVFAAFVLRPDRGTAARWIRLGPAEPIERAVNQWRQRFVSSSRAGTPQAVSRAEAFEPTHAEGGSVSPARRLRTLIWERLEPELDGCHTVVLLPDGALHRLPWAALPGREQDEFLIQDYALATASSGTELYGLLSAPPVKLDPRLLVVGGLLYDKRTPQRTSARVTPLLRERARSLEVTDDARQWNYLPGAAAELTAVTDVWADRGPVQRLQGLEADELTLARLLPDYRFVHLATHGFFDTHGEVYRVNLREQSLYASQSALTGRGASLAGRNPLLMTGIVLTGANLTPEKDSLGVPVGEDNVLTAEEILALRLNDTELVTLSACETGLGDVAAGEGVMGLTRALHQAGARSVIASLWKVDDRATQILMEQFYENLWQKKMSRIDALREAQLWLLRHPKELEEMGVSGAATRGLIRRTKQVDPRQKSVGIVDRTDPYFWAAFQLSGDWR